MPIRRKRERRVNPYFRQRRPKQLRRHLLRVGVPVVIAGLLAFLLYAPIWHVQEVEVHGAGEASAEQIQLTVESHLQRRALMVFPQRHKWFIRQDRLSQTLLAQLPLNRADISRDGRMLTIDVQEKIRTFYVLRDDVLYAVDRNGLVLSIVDDVERARLSSEPQRIPIIEDARGGGLKEGDTVLPANHLAQIVTLFDIVQSRTMLTPTGALLADEEGRVDVRTDAGVLLYVNVAKDLTPQIDKLSSLIDRKLVDITTLRYIDLRFTNRLFYN